MRITAKIMVNIIFTILVVKNSAQETKTGPVSGWIQGGARIDPEWIQDVLSKSKNAEWDTGESISILKKFRTEEIVDCSYIQQPNLIKKSIHYYSCVKLVILVSIK